MLNKVLFEECSGQTCQIGGGLPQASPDILCTLLVALGKPESELKYITGRPGHDCRHAIDYSKTADELNWSPIISFADGIRQRVEWYRADRYYDAQYSMACIEAAQVA